MDFMEQLGRVGEIRNAETPGTYIKQRLAENAQSMSKRGELQARVEVINEALTKFVALLYQADTDGGFCNVDRITYRILVPAPFGSSGWRKWGLRAWEATELRKFLAQRSKQRGKRPPLFDYNEASRTWHLNTSDYGSFDLAMHYIQREPVTTKALRQMSGQYRQGRVTVVSSHRQGTIKQ